MQFILRWKARWLDIFKVQIAKFIVLQLACARKIRLSFYMYRNGDGNLKSEMALRFLCTVLADSKGSLKVQLTFF